MSVTRDGRARLALTWETEGMTVDVGATSVALGRNGRKITLHRSSPISLRVAAGAMLRDSPLLSSLDLLSRAGRRERASSLTTATLEIGRLLLTRSALGPPRPGETRWAVDLGERNIRPASAGSADCWAPYWAALHGAALDLTLCAGAATEAMDCRFDWCRRVVQAYYGLLECARP